MMRFVNVLGGLEAEITVGEGTGRAPVENLSSPGVESPPPPRVLRASMTHSLSSHHSESNVVSRFVELSVECLF